MCQLYVPDYHTLIFSPFTAEKAARGPQADKNAPKDIVEELDQVAGNAEDDIGDRIAAIRENELLFGPDSQLETFGPMLVHICGSPHKFKVTSYPRAVRMI